MCASSHYQDDSAGSGAAAVAPGCTTRSAVAPFVVEVPLAGLRLWPGNPRTIRPQRLEDLKASYAGGPGNAVGAAVAGTA
jgi:hypothetical protein